MRLHALMALALLAGCSPDLAVPEGALINCASDADCPEDFACRLSTGECVSGASLDKTPPQLVSASVASPEALVLTFNERIDIASAGDPAHYNAVPPLAFTSALVGGEGQTVVLAVERQEDTRYVLTVSDVTDEVGNVIAPPNDSASFNGVPVTPDPTPPELLVPSDLARLLKVTEVELRWAERVGARSYTVELAHDVGFSQHFAGSPFTVLPDREGGKPPNTLRLDAPAPLTYYWRVRADITSGSGAVGRFDIVGDTLHVNCPAFDPCVDSGQSGNASSAYGTIGRAIANAKADGIDRVLVAGRGPAGTPYDELVIVANGVNLYGGYDPSFAEELRGSYETSIRGSSSVTLYVEDIDLPTVVDGFVIDGGSSSEVRPVQLVRSQAFTLRNCIINGGVAEERSIAVDIVDSGAPKGIQPHIDGCTITSSAVTVASHAVRATNSYVSIASSTLESGTSGGDSIGLEVQGGLFLSDSSVAAGDSGVSSTAVLLTVANSIQRSRIERSSMASAIGATSHALWIVDNTDLPPVVVINNTMSAGDVTAETMGAEVSQAVLVNNTVRFGGCIAAQVCYRFGVRISPPGEASIVANNIIFSEATNVGGACLHIKGGGVSAPRRIENNLFFGCPSDGFLNVDDDFNTNIFFDVNDLNDPANYAVNGAPLPDSATANFTDASAASYFVDPAGGDWHLGGSTPDPVARGGLDASGVDYGGVTIDFDTMPRSCPTPPADCFSVGAYEF